MRLRYTYGLKVGKFFPKHMLIHSIPRGKRISTIQKTLKTQAAAYNYMEPKQKPKPEAL